MLNSQHRLILQRLVVGAMLVAILGFGIARYLRVEEAAKNKNSVTYDSDLHDRSRSRTTIPISDESTISYPDQLRFDLNRTKQLLDTGKEDDAIKVLDKIVSTTDSLSSDERNLAESQKISERVSDIEQNLFTGRNQEAVKKLVDLQDSLSSQTVNQ